VTVFSIGLRMRVLFARRANWNCDYFNCSRNGVPIDIFTSKEYEVEVSEYEGFGDQK